MQVVIDGLMTEYDRSGSGQKALLLHGWGDNRKSFDSLMRELKGSEFVRLDLPGFGATQTPEHAYNLKTYAEFVKRFIEKIDFKPAIVIGHSNGGAIAIKGVSTDLLQPDKLVLIASSGVRSTYNNRKKALRIIAKIAKFPLKLLPERLSVKIKKQAYKTVGSELFVAENMQDTFKKVVTEDLQADSKHITIPTLLIYGSQDTATTPQHALMLSQNMATASVQIIDGAGHFVHQSHAELVAKHINQFLSDD